MKSIASLQAQLLNLSKERSLAQLKQNIKSTFATRNINPVYSLSFSDSELNQLETYWGHFLNRDEVKDAPITIAQTIKKINAFIKALANE
jgi:hypothetical protein